MIEMRIKFKPIKKEKGAWPVYYCQPYNSPTGTIFVSGDECWMEFYGVPREKVELVDVEIDYVDSEGFEAFADEFWTDGEKFILKGGKGR